MWSGWLRNQGLNRLSNAGLLVGLDDIAEARGLDVKPYLLGTSAAAPGRGSARAVNDVDVGADIFYNPTPGVRTNLTINTDFAQTEVDQRLTNLERFPQFFPEKRDFFLDGATFFDFQSSAANDNSLLPFFTRRIGLNQGVPQQIRAGGKLAGQFGSNDVGAMYVRTGREEDAIGENFLVLRGKHRMFRQSYVGALYTGRHVARCGPRRAPHDRRRLPARDVDVPRRREHRARRLLPEHHQPARHRPQRRLRAAARLSERPVERQPALPRDPGELRRGGRLHAAHRLPPAEPRAVLHEPSDAGTG